MTAAEFCELAFIPPDFSPEALDQRSCRVNALRKQKQLDAQQLCLDTENATEIDIVLRRTAQRGRRQFSWVWRDSGEKCPPIAILLNQFSPAAVSRITEFDRQAIRFNHTLAATESELSRLRESRQSGQIHELAVRE